MYLKRIELSGFKSFAKKTTLAFGSHVVAIVGPNGSGKSNVVEAIRFVLGEQSMKSMRGKSSTDLIFKGSKSLSAPSRASVAITFDNRERIFSFADRTDAPELTFDEITLTREVYSDGKSNYSINGSEVRLKDIVELLASVHIGSSGHHIISQGEADRILSANARDRRAMIEDALGLKVYQYRIRDAERKIERTNENMKEVNVLRREIAPHLQFLKRQVEKIEKGREMRIELGVAYTTYFSDEQLYLEIERKRLYEEQKRLSDELGHLQNRQEEVSIGKKQEVVQEETMVRELERIVIRISAEYEEIVKKIARLEGIIEAKQATTHEEVQEERLIKEQDVRTFIDEITLSLDQALREETTLTIKEILVRLTERLKGYLPVIHQTDKHQAVEKEILTLKDSLAELKTLELQTRENREIKNNELVHARKLLENRILQEREDERESFELKRRETELLGMQEVLHVRQETLSAQTTAFNEEVEEAKVLLGNDSVTYDVEHGANITRAQQEDRRKHIERLKIKIEDIGGGSGSDIVKEYQETSERDQFLSKELTDLEGSLDELKKLLVDLRDKLEHEFKAGIEKITTQFDAFFGLMFGGGHASLQVVVEHRGKNEEDEEGIPVDSGTKNIVLEKGIEIAVALPHKKVRDLHMLSGGERSLTSIALLFAMSQVNPPPFLVLDETDAALDEANSRKYGDMIENLSAFSQLIVVTHNRETMSRANILYGVTIGSDGGSKLLSIKFDEAVRIAK